MPRSACAAACAEGLSGLRRGSHRRPVDARQAEAAHRILIRDAVELHRGLPAHIFWMSIMAMAKPSTASPSAKATNSRLRMSSSGFSAAAPSAAEPILPTA